LSHGSGPRPLPFFARRLSPRIHGGMSCLDPGQNAGRSESAIHPSPPLVRLKAYKSPSLGRLSVLTRSQSTLHPAGRPAEFSIRAVLLGSFLGIVFGLVTVYVALEVGLNFSASIPIAVLSITVFKLGGPSILENNIVQTVGSAGESIAAGVVYTIVWCKCLGGSVQTQLSLRA
jgi:OPT oligopeptide transporter protein